MAEKETPDSVASAGFSVPGMVCDGCAERVRGVLTALPGVREVTPKPWRKRVEVRYEPASVQEGQIKAALGAAGFDAVEA